MKLHIYIYKKEEKHLEKIENSRSERNSVIAYQLVVVVNITNSFLSNYVEYIYIYIYIRNCIIL